MRHFSDYDRFAWAYNRHWSYFDRQVLPILDRLVLKGLPPGAHVLDLCCGTGQLARALTDRGYQVTGLDGSEEMIRFARENAPEADFVVDDARSFSSAGAYHAAVSTFDSLNHVMTLEELASVFCNVNAALHEGGLFLFDLNTEEGFKAKWHGGFDIVEDDCVCVVRCSYCPETRVAQFDATVFRLDGAWQRSDVTLRQTWYSLAEVSSALEGAGFTGIRPYALDEREELTGSTDGAQRLFFLCRKPLAAGAG